MLLFVYPPFVEPAGPCQWVDGCVWGELVSSSRYSIEGCPHPLVLVGFCSRVGKCGTGCRPSDFFLGLAPLMTRIYMAVYHVVIHFKPDQVYTIYAGPPCQCSFCFLRISFKRYVCVIFISLSSRLFLMLSMLYLEQEPKSSTGKFKIIPPRTLSAAQVNEDGHLPAPSRVYREERSPSRDAYGAIIHRGSREFSRSQDSGERRSRKRWIAKVQVPECSTGCKTPR